jgi:DNA polymerase-3 subunit delta'
VSYFTFAEQAEAKRLLGAALAEGPAHAYLLHGPPGVGKRAAAREFAGSLVGDRARVARRAHPDVYELQALGEMIRIDAIRELRRDLHMRPFEAERRVYLIFDADELNDDAADALLKDLEEPPPYAVVVLVADARAPELAETERIALARVAAGRLDRLDRVLDERSAGRRAALLEVARDVYTDPAFEPADAAAILVAAAKERGAEAKEQEEAALDRLDVPAREADQRVRRAQRGAEREELLAVLEELASWYRDLVAVAVGADGVVVHADRLAELREDASRERLVGATEAAEAVRETWRALEEFNLTPALALESLFVTLRRRLAA